MVKKKLIATLAKIKEQQALIDFYERLQNDVVAKRPYNPQMFAEFERAIEAANEQIAQLQKTYFS